MQFLYIYQRYVEALNENPFSIVLKSIVENHEKQAFY